MIRSKHWIPFLSVGITPKWREIKRIFWKWNRNSDHQIIKKKIHSCPTKTVDIGISCTFTWRLHHFNGWITPISRFLFVFFTFCKFRYLDWSKLDSFLATLLLSEVLFLTDLTLSQKECGTLITFFTQRLEHDEACDAEVIKGLFALIQSKSYSITDEDACTIMKS
jgi:hypothetical protein